MMTMTESSSKRIKAENKFYDMFYGKNVAVILDKPVKGMTGSIKGILESVFEQGISIKQSLGKKEFHVFLNWDSIKAVKEIS